MSTEYHVLDHHLDESDKDSPVYRLTVGVPEEITVPVTNDDGSPKLRLVPLTDEHGEPQRDVDGKEIVVYGPPELQTITHYPVKEDYVFAADDERWEGKSPEEIAKEQRAEIQKAIRARAKEQERQAAAIAERKQLPGSGEAL